MGKLPRISDAEWRVMQAVWVHAPITALEVVRRLAPATGWKSRTIKSMLGRLVKKGALTFEVRGNRYLYRPAVSREDCLKQAGESFLHRVFGGDSASLLMHFAQNTELNDAELEQLGRILADRQNEGEA